MKATIQVAAKAVELLLRTSVYLVLSFGKYYKQTHWLRRPLLCHGIALLFPISKVRIARSETELSIGLATSVGNTLKYFF